MEDIGKLDGELAVERVILQEEAKIFRAEGPVLVEGLLTEATGLPIPVYSYDGKRIGFASLTFNGRGQQAVAMNLEYASEERLLIETGCENLYAHRIPNGIVLSITPNGLLPVKEQKRD